MITMWFDILKNAKTVAQTQGGFDFEEEEIPEKDEQDNCKKWLKGLYDIMNKYQDIDYGHPYAYKKGPSQNVIKLDKIPENVACAIKDFYTETSDVYEIDTNITDIQPFFDKHGVDKEQFSHQDVYINTYFAGLFMYSENSLIKSHILLLSLCSPERNFSTSLSTSSLAGAIFD